MKKKKERTKLLILSVLLMLITAVTAYGAGAPDDSDKGSIIVNMRDGDGEPVGGGEMAAWKVADVRVSISGGNFDDSGELKNKEDRDPRLDDYCFTVREDFKMESYDSYKDFDGRITGLSGEEIEGEDHTGWMDLADDLWRYVDETGIPAMYTKTIDENGIASFDDLEIGLYLLIQTVHADGCSSVNPFLVSLPRYDGEKEGDDGQIYPDYLYVVFTYPKTGPLSAFAFGDGEDGDGGIKGGISHVVVTDGEEVRERPAWEEYGSVTLDETAVFGIGAPIPGLSAYDTAHHDIHMVFYESANPELLIDDDERDVLVYIGGKRVEDRYYNVTFNGAAGIMTLAGTGGDDWSFSVDIDVTSLYKDGYVTEKMLETGAEAEIFFRAGLTDLNDRNRYNSDAWYEVRETNGESVNEPIAGLMSGIAQAWLYTYSIEIYKTDMDTDAPLAAVEFTIYRDGSCTEAVERNAAEYVIVTADDGTSAFVGLGKGEWYVKETKARSLYYPRGDIDEVVLDAGPGDCVYELYVTNERTSIGSRRQNRADGGSGGGGGGGGGSTRPTGLTGATGGEETGPGVNGDAEEDESWVDGGFNIWNLLPIPKTGQGWALMAALLVMAAAGAGLIIANRIKKKSK